MCTDKFLALALIVAIGCTPAIAFPGEARADGPGRVSSAFQQRFGGEVAATGASDGDSLTWDAATRRWVPRAGGGGGSQTLAQVLTTGHTALGTQQMILGKGDTPALTFSTGAGGNPIHILGPSDHELIFWGGSSGGVPSGPGSGTGVGRGLIFYGGDSDDVNNAGDVRFGGGSAYGSGNAGNVQLECGTSVGGSPGKIIFSTGNGITGAFTGDGNLVVNQTGTALAQNATDGFFYLPRCATGAPSGTPRSFGASAAALVVGGDHHLYAELTSGSWSQVDGGGGSSPIFVDVYNSVSVACSSNTHTLLPFDTEQHKDSVGIHDNATHNSRLVCQRTGLKHIKWSCDSTSSSNIISAQVDLYINGSGYGGAGDYSMMRWTGNAERRSASLDVYANAGDYFELDAYGTTSGGIAWAFNGHFSMVED